jgi:hypothetical protein
LSGHKNSKPQERCGAVFEWTGQALARAQPCGNKRAASDTAARCAGRHALRGINAVAGDIGCAVPIKAAAQRIPNHIGGRASTGSVAQVKISAHWRKACDSEIHDGSPKPQ